MKVSRFKWIPRFITAEMLQDLVPPVELTKNQQKALDRLIERRRAILTGTGGTAQSVVRTKRKILHRLMVLYHNGYVHSLGIFIFCL
jgi:hypothetical protein